jgi:hypothetical protein
MDPITKALAGLVVAATLSLPLTVTAGAQSRVPEAGSPATRPIQEMPENMRRAMGCNAPAGAGTTHNVNVTTPQAWTEATSPHLVPYDINVSATVTIDPCAVVRIASGKTISILAGGEFIATGLQFRPARIERYVGAGPWTQIRVMGGVLSLTRVIVAGGGASLPAVMSQSAALRVQSGKLHVEDVEIADSQSQGVLLNGTGGFDAASQSLRIHGSAGFPVSAFANVIGTIPSGQYQGNAVDAIGIGLSGGPVRFTQTMANHGVPYHVGTGQDGGRLDVNSLVTGQTAVLTIQPGVVIAFPPGGMLYVAGRETSTPTDPARGALIANAGGGPPVVFTTDQSAVPAPGSWIGIRIGNPVDPRTLLNNVKILFAGGVDTAQSNSCPYPGYPVNNDAAIRVLGVPPTQVIANSEIVGSARHGIDRGWQSNTQPDLLPSNTVTPSTTSPGGACRQTTPKNANGSNCPTSPQSPPCP